MGKKKPFIDRKKAQHFHVVHRSQRDPKAHDPGASKYVLLSSNKQVEFDTDADFFEEENEFSDDDDLPDLIPSEKSHKKSKDKQFPRLRKVTFADGLEVADAVDEDGFVQDGYNYRQHMKTMGSHGGKFYSADGRFASAHEDPRSRVIIDEDDVIANEQDRLLEAITLTTDGMDPDLREALANAEAFETLDDDFMTKAAAELEDSNTCDDFDYDAHIARLMEAASGVRRPVSGDDSDQDESEDEEFVTDEEEEADYAVAVLNKDDDQRILDELFEKTLDEEYNSDEVGELDEDDEDVRGDMELSDGILLDQLLDEVVNIQQEYLDKEGRLGNPLRTGNHLKEIIEECEANRLAENLASTPNQPEDEEALAKIIAINEAAEKEAADEESAAIERNLTQMMIQNEYLAPRVEEQWDCETIVSTYSNLDNHPTILKMESNRSRSRKRESQNKLLNINEESLSQNKTIPLSRKTGMPLGIFEHTPRVKKVADAEHYRDDEIDGSVMRPADIPHRTRSETKEEKKARKAAMKLMKSNRRVEKKQWKRAFKDEEARQESQTQGGKVSVFKY